MDDSPQIRALVQHYLESSGFVVVGTGSDGDEAIELAHRYQPDVVLLDTSMPKVDGIEALPVVLAVSPRTRVVMYTGFDEPGLARHARSLGASAFIAKSMPLEELADRLGEALDRPSPTPRLRLSVVESESPTTAGPDIQPTEGQMLLEEHLQGFRQFFDRAQIGMGILTTSGTVIRANRVLAAMMSAAPDNLIGVDYGRLMSGDANLLDAALHQISAAGDGHARLEHRLPGSATRVVQVALAPVLDTTGRVLYVFAQAQELTESRKVEEKLRKSEESFQSLVTSTPEYAIYMLDTEGKVISWNVGAEHIKGYTRGEIIGCSFEIFYPRDERESGRPERHLVAALEDGHFAEEGWRVRKDGSQFWAAVAISPVHDKAGQHIGYAKVTRDQTETRKRQEERNRLAEEQTYRLAVAAHELRTPTAVIDGSAQLLQADPSLIDGAQEQLLSTIRASACRLRRLAKDLSAASRLRLDTTALRLGETSLHALLRDAALRAESAVSGLNIDLHEPARDLALHVDAGRLEQAIDNLVTNAVRHGSPPIRLTAQVGDDVRIIVSDSGPGVPADVEPRLFERFAHGPAGGSGVGLNLAREIARGHGGDVRYLPQETGAAFEIVLPASTIR